MKSDFLETANIFVENPIFFPPEYRTVEGSGALAIPAVSCVMRRDFPEQKFIELVERGIQCLSPIISIESELVLFCAHWQFFDDTVMVRHKGLWQSNSLLKDIIANVYKRGPERMIKIGKQIRFYGLCSVRIREARFAMEAIRSMQSCFGVIDDSLEVASERTADELYNLAFPDPTKRDLQWPSLVPRIAQGSRTLVRVTGWFDDREATIDLFNWPKSGTPT